MCFFLGSLCNILSAIRRGDLLRFNLFGRRRQVLRAHEQEVAQRHEFDIEVRDDLTIQN